MSTSTWLIVGVVAAGGCWWLLNRKEYAVLGSNHYEYFKDLEAAREYKKTRGGRLYEIPSGSEFSGNEPPRGAKLIANPRRAKRRRKSRA